VRDNSNIDRDRSHRVDREIAKIADRQQINITRAQLISVGVDDDGIRYRRRKGNLYLIHRAVYSVGRPARLGPERASAAVLACGGGAALADEAAAASWGFRKWPYPPYTVFDERERRHKGINTRRVKLHPKDIRRHEGIRVTSPARTALDLAAHLPDKQLKRAIDEARMSPTARLTLNQLRGVVARYPHHPGAKRVRWFLGITQEEPNRSGYEDEFDEFCEERGFPRPVTNRVMHGYRIDKFFVDENVAVELDGWITHSDEFADDDNNEQEATLLEHGIPTLRIKRRRFEENPDREERRLRRILERRRRERGLAAY
jgi:very-short-patch-repair endonuclease